MDVVDQSFNKDLAEVKARCPGTNSVTEFAFDDGMDSFTLPALAI